jgi:hypothetical protein
MKLFPVAFFGEDLELLFQLLEINLAHLDATQLETFC